MTAKEIYTYINQISKQKIAAEAEANRYRNMWDEEFKKRIKFQWLEFLLGIGCAVLMAFAIVAFLPVHK